MGLNKDKPKSKNKKFKRNNFKELVSGESKKAAEFLPDIISEALGFA